jgi:hypothetical protein
MKKCLNCGEEKELNEFHKHAASKDGHQGNCKVCALSYRNTKGKEKQLKQRYGITIEEYNDLFLKQGGKCAICSKHQSEFKIALAVDHNHETKEIRGLLCFNCNMGIGRLQDSIELLKQAIVYLKSFSDKRDTYQSCPR